MKCVEMENWLFGSLVEPSSHKSTSRPFDPLHPLIHVTLSDIPTLSEKRKI